VIEPSPPNSEGKLEIRVHRIRRAIYLRSLVFFLVSFAGLLVSMSILIWQWQNAITNFGPAALIRWITIPVWATLIFSVVTVISFIMLRRNRRSEIQVSNMGLTIQRGKSLETINWDSVALVRTKFERYGFLSISWAKESEIHIKTEDGIERKFNQTYERIDDLIEEIKQFVYPKLLEEYRLAFNRGEPLSFGPLVLTSDGILNGRRALRWKDLKSINFERGSLKLQPFEDSKGPQFSIPAYKVPNIDLCIQLINHLSPQT
jgi:hypothetical protein